jgi:hypothetical protein
LWVHWMLTREGQRFSYFWNYNRRLLVLIINLHLNSIVCFQSSISSYEGLKVCLQLFTTPVSQFSEIWQIRVITDTNWFLMLTDVRELDSLSLKWLSKRENETKMIPKYMLNYSRFRHQFADNIATLTWTHIRVLEIS